MGKYKTTKPSLPRHPGWLEINLEIHPDGHDALSSFLFDMGCQGIESGSPQSDSLKAYMNFREDFDQVRLNIDGFLQELTLIFPNITTYSLSIKIIEEQDWNTEWRKFFKSEQITENLTIIPEWEPVPENMEGHVIIIDPGPAFGSGKHSTTRMCLAAMEKIGFSEPWNMLDVGTGSGILSIYGIMLGASCVTAIDIDIEAIRWAKWNIQINKIPPKIYLASESLEKIKGSFFLITANLILGTIIELLPQITEKLIPKGYLILSGLLSEEVEKVEGYLTLYGLKKIEVFYEKEWAGILVSK